MNCGLQDSIIRYVLIISLMFYLFIDFVFLPNHTIFPDESRFLSEAKIFANKFEFWTYNNRAWEMPLTGIIYGIFVYFFKDYSVYAIRIFQIFLMLISALYIYKLTDLLFKNKNISFISFIIFLFYPPFVYYQGLLLSEILFTTFLILSFYFIYKWKEDNFKLNQSFFLSLVFFMLCVYTKATLTIFPVFVFAFWVLFFKGFKYATKIFAVTLLGYILILSFWWVRNYVILNQFVLFTTSSGANLYLGNNLANKNGGVDWSSDVDLQFVKKIESLSINEVEKNKIYKKKAISFILNNSKKFLELALKKFMRFWNFQFNNKKFKKSIYNYIMIISFSPIFIGFLLALYLMRKNLLDLIPIIALIVYFTLLHSLVISSLRYRLPIEPFLIILSSYTFYFLYNSFVKKQNDKTKY